MRTLAVGTMTQPQLSPDVESDEYNWRSLYKVGAVAALIIALAQKEKSLLQ
jgi:hypothetical protein